jgi:pimeloyl-ACP methyl ester carboxylesterase
MTATAPPRAPSPDREEPSRPWSVVGPVDAPAVVFVHATRLSRALWAPQLARLGTRFRCIAVDLPGHGVLADQPFTVDAATAVIRDAVDTESASGRAVIVGLSLGGYVAIDAAGAYPDRVAGLVLAGCSAEPVGAMAWPFRMLATTLERAPRGGLDVANRAFFRLRYGGPVAQDLIEAGFWSAGGAAALRQLVGRRYLDRLARLWAPVVIVNGALDPVFGPQGHYWAASCRRGRHVVIPRAMHLSNLDRPAAFAGIVAGFTDRLARGA